MAVTPITNVNSTNTTTNSGLDPGTTNAATSSTMLDRDAFLKLLVAQLKYQDPSKPVDASEMISQSASLSVVDKLDQISTAPDRRRRDQPPEPRRLDHRQADHLRRSGWLSGHPTRHRRSASTGPR